MTVEEMPEMADEDDGSGPDHDQQSGRGRLSGWLRAAALWPRRLGNRARQAVVGALAVFIIAGAGGLIYVWTAAGSAADDVQAGASALASARADLPKLLSYDFRNIDQEFPKTAQTMLTGEFLDQYRELGASVIQPAAKREQIVTKAEVVDAGLVSAAGDSATVLLFINQTTTSKDADGPRLDGSRVRVTLTMDDGRWRISEFTPV